MGVAGSESVAGRRKCLHWNLGEPGNFKEAVEKRKNRDEAVCLPGSRTNS